MLGNIPAIDSGISCEGICAGGTESVSGIINLNPVHTSVVGSEYTNTANVSECEHSRVAACCLRCAKCNSICLSYSGDGAKGGAGVRGMEQAFISRHPDIA